MQRLIPLESFLHRIFPVSYYSDKQDEIVRSRAFAARNDSEPVFLTMPVDWEATDRREDRNWRMQLQGWAVFHPIMNFFDEYEDKAAILDFFFDLAGDWFSRYGEDADDIVTSRMPDSYAWYDMSVGFRALVIAFFQDRIRHHQLEITPERERLLASLAQKHIRNLANPVTFSLNNHGMFQMQGLLALIHLNDAEDFAEKKAYGLKQMEALVCTQFDANGVHLEHSPHYHFYACDIFSAVVAAGWYGEEGPIHARLKKAGEVKKWIVDPLRRPACIGDSILTVQESVAFPVEPAGEAGYVISDFHDSGYAVVRSDWTAAPETASYFFLMAAYHAKTHKHRDCLSFEWFEQGRKVICDSGKYGYKSDKYRSYFLSHRAHNTVEIEGFDILKLSPYHSAVQEVMPLGDGVFLLKAAFKYPAVSHARSLYLKPGHWLAIADTLSFNRSRKFRQWFHTPPHLRLRSRQGLRAVFEDEEGKEALRITCLNPQLTACAYRGDEEGMQGFVSEKDYSFQPADAIGFSGAAENTRIITLLSLSGAAEKEALGFVRRLALVPEPWKEKAKLLAVSIAGRLRDIWRKKALSPFDVSVGGAEYSIEAPHGEMRFYANIRKGSERLLVMLPGAFDRAKGIHTFQRKKWAREIDSNVVSFADPTLTEGNDINIGWFQGKRKAYAFDDLVWTVRRIAAKLRIAESDITFFGSSAGGFTALKLGEVFLNSTVIAINPQIRIFAYSKEHYTRVLNYTYEGLSVEEVEKRYADRVQVTLDYSRRRKPVFVCQNREDQHHMQKHLLPYLDTVPEAFVNRQEGTAPPETVNKLNVLFYENEGQGHAPPDKETTLRLLEVLSPLRLNA